MVYRILILFAHPAIRRSRINRAMIEAARDLPFVSVHDLYENYPDFAIDVDREQALLDQHDVLVFQHPFFWYSGPSLIKEWLDLVLEHGWAYGRHGHHLSGKPWMHALTTGGREAFYSPTGPNRFTIDELLRPYEATASLCKAHWQKPFVVYGGHIAEVADIAAAATDYRARLQDLARRGEKGPEEAERSENFSG